MDSITFDEFYKQYKLKRNPIELVTPYENTMLDFGDTELDFLDTQPTNQVWSLLDEDERFVLYPGIEYKNIVGYFVTDRSWISRDEKYVLK